MSNNKNVQRRGRTLSLTVKELMESQRLKLAVELYDKDPLLLKAIFTELALGSLSVGRNTIIKRVSMNDGLPKYHLIPLLRSIDLDEFNTFDLFWGLSEQEQKLYIAKANGASKEELEKMVDGVNKRLGITKLMNENNE